METVTMRKGLPDKRAVLFILLFGLLMGFGAIGKAIKNNTGNPALFIAKLTSLC